MVFRSRWGFQTMLSSAIGMMCFIAFLNICVYICYHLTMESLLLQEGAIFRHMEFFPDYTRRIFEGSPHSILLCQFKDCCGCEQVADTQQHQVQH